MFSYYQIHPTSINKTDGTPSSEDGVRADTNIITNSWNLQSTSWCIKSIQKARPTTPPNGFISAFLVMLTTIGILGILTGLKCHHILTSTTPILSLASEGAATPCIPIPLKDIVDCISLSSEEAEDDLWRTSHWIQNNQSTQFGLGSLQDSLPHLSMLMQKNSTHKFTSTWTQYSLSVTIQLLDIFVMTFKNSSLDLFAKPIKV
jgi:hypothetical protein